MGKLLVGSVVSTKNSHKLAVVVSVRPTLPCLVDPAVPFHIFAFVACSVSIRIEPCAIGAVLTSAYVQ